MSKSKIIALTALIIFAFAIVGLSNAVAGEKFKGRTVKHNVKWEPINVPDEEGHVIAVYEHKGIGTNMEGKTFGDGTVSWETGLLDMNFKTGLGSGHGYGVVTDRDGDKYFFTWKGKRVRGEKGWTGYWISQWTIVKGTGKYEGIQGKGTSYTYNVAKGQSYSDWEAEVELP